jgi:2-dehydro-3-deoxy-D-gluconate 5-dehydrogenase
VIHTFRDKFSAEPQLVKRSLENQETLSQIQMLGRRAVIVQCDLSSKEQVGSIVRKITGRKEEDGMGMSIDILVNCGGIQRRFFVPNFE